MTSMKIKIAKPREEYAGLGLYVSEEGNIYRKGKELKWAKDSSGNFRVLIEDRPVFVHKLVQETFNQVRPEGSDDLIVHLDGNKGNNSAKNLTLMSRSDHTILLRGAPKPAGENDRLEQIERKKKVSPQRKTHCHNGHEFNLENTYYRKDGGRSCRVCGRDRKRAKKRS